jgi:adenosylcobinamide-GDP ribazoletransferase
VSTRHSPLDSLGEAVRFLTVLPWPGLPAPDPARLARSAAAFPLAGLLIGAFTAAAGFGAHWLFGAPLHAILALSASVVITAGLHLDGLADSADALFSWRPREKKLEILRDSRIGTMGALALFLVLGLKLSALLALGEAWWQGALLAPVWGRWGALCGLFAFPSARPDGLGASVRAQLAPGRFVVATVGALFIGGLACPPWGALAGLPAAAASWWAGSAMTRSLGGLTGDSYGTLGEIGETVTLLGLVALHHHGWISKEFPWPI